MISFSNMWSHKELYKIKVGQIYIQNTSDEYAHNILRKYFLHSSI